MLHSTLPRAFLPPGLGYLGGYYGDDSHAYPASATYVPCIEDPYARITDQRLQLGNSWDSGARPMSPSPLDLSLKPPIDSSPTRQVDVESIEEDDDADVDLRLRVASARRSLPAKRSYSNSEVLTPSMEVPVSEIRRSSSVHDYPTYGDASLPEDIVAPSLHHTRLHQEEILRAQPIHSYTSYEDVPMKKEVLDPQETGPKAHHSQDPSSASGHRKSYQIHADPQKHHTGSPGHPRNQTYHQQLLQTPQHHLQGIHAPMTPPSTPSPPQCPRRRHRDEPDVTPPHSSIAVSLTPKGNTGHGEKLSQRPKKKHARRLKFDEDTSSPVSGTVILGPDEAVVTGDIDPAFNIVEVTDEARAELAKIENRLGPYECKLCRQLHDDAFQLAQHRCSRIAHVEYRCPECDKRFSCPANLASHRRWHKPRMSNGENPNGSAAVASNSPSSSSTAKDSEIACSRCDVKFTRPAALRKHLATQHPETNNNVSMANNNNNNNNNNSNDNNSGFDDLSISMSGKPMCVPVSMHLGNTTLTNEIP